MEKLRVALMDMNNGIPNQGFRSLNNILKDFEKELSVDKFDVRQKHQVPGLKYNIYISSGGPGDPRKGDGVWEKQWLKMVDDVWEHNQGSDDKKFFFFVCHSFQMACHHFGLCDVTKRKSTSFGIYPIHKTAAGKKDPLLENLDDPYFAVDSRDWQLVKPKTSLFKQYGAEVLSLEKIRTHVEYERAIMAIRFSREMVGTQFHPEAEPKDMKKHFRLKENRDKVIKNFNLEKYESMMSCLDDPKTIAHTHRTVIPGFLNDAIQSLSSIQYH